MAFRFTSQQASLAITKLRSGGRKLVFLKRIQPEAFLIFKKFGHFIVD